MSEKQELRGLTGLRFVAAFYVFLFHVHSSWPITQNKFLSNLLSQGAIGMSAFFILSGFVLTYQYQDGAKSMRNYFISRVARIYPIYLLTALITLPWFGVSTAESLLKGLVQGCLLVVANLFLVQAWFPQFFGFWNDGGSWSISVEAFCYAVLPLILPLLVRLTWNQQRAIAAICFFLAVMPGLVLKVFDSSAPVTFYSMPIFRLPEFLIGCLVCIAWSRGHLKPVGKPSLIAASAVFAIYLSWAGSRMPMYVGHNWIAIPMIIFAILAFADPKLTARSFVAGSVMVWLGKISYSFYSFQVFLLMMMHTYVYKVTTQFPGLANNLVFVTVGFTALLGMSAVGYYLIEEPCRRWIRAKLATPSMAPSLPCGETRSASDLTNLLSP
jgi:peptidoglycan/LPS O-acetylase OafA/YrhL